MNTTTHRDFSGFHQDKIHCIERTLIKAHAMRNQAIRRILASGLRKLIASMGGMAFKITPTLYKQKVMN